MSFFQNSAINRLYLHSALQGLAEYGGGAFVLVFLLKAGAGLPVVFLSVAAIVLLRLGFRQLVLPLARRIGVKAALGVGIAIGALAYLPMGHVHGLDAMLAFFLVLAGMGDAFYWACYHAMTAKLGDTGARGAQVSAIQVIYALSNILGPLIGGFLQVEAGPQIAFGLAGLVRLASLWPLLSAPNIGLEENAMAPRAARLFAAQVYFFDGFMGVSTMNAFSLALFVTLGENFKAFGLALAVAALFGAVMGLGIGRLFDLGHPKFSTAIGMCAILLYLACATLGYGHALTAMAALSLGAIAGPLYASAYNARVYNLSKASGDPLRFQIWGEGGWDLGAATGAALAAGLTYAGFSFTWPIAMGFLGAFGVWFTLHQSYLKAEPSLRE